MRGYWESTFVNYLIECLSTAGADLHVTDQSDELIKLKNRILNALKPRIIQTQMIKTAVNDLLKKYRLNYKRQKELFRKREKETPNAITLLSTN